MEQVPGLMWTRYQATERRESVSSKSSPQQGDLRFSGQGASGGARTRNRRVPAHLRADSQATVPPTP
ncbi:hypothetical protein PoB_001756900 [Plakobranchus ocellatus]|uniref:Uncharacterized protein n=1 Tax=Plakobranchus ocellatus TaxID=259542 RepID=A0AAV3Z6V9_9GAST|nr:hypothetical protein PoB_001756900 [Plakobranchus ocellatus]